jgi:hypothetical protein
MWMKNLAWWPFLMTENAASFRDCVSSFAVGLSRARVQMWLFVIGLIATLISDVLTHPGYSIFAIGVLMWPIRDESGIPLNGWSDWRVDAMFISWFGGLLTCFAGLTGLLLAALGKCIVRLLGERLQVAWLNLAGRIVNWLLMAAVFRWLLFNSLVPRGEDGFA